MDGWTDDNYVSILQLEWPPECGSPPLLLIARTYLQYCVRWPPPPVGRLGGGGGGGGRGGGTEVPAGRQQQRQRPTTDRDHFL